MATAGHGLGPSKHGAQHQSHRLHVHKVSSAAACLLQVHSHSRAFTPAVPSAWNALLTTNASAPTSEKPQQGLFVLS